ncbi:MAG: tyrosine-type recombinase/integrase [Candidatus Scatovivens sp.]
MPRKKGESLGSVYYDKSKKRFVAQCYIVDYSTGQAKRKAKYFQEKKEAERYLESLMYQRSNSLYIKNNGIPLNQLMRANLQKKLDTNLISENQYGRVLKTIEVIESSFIAKKKIDELTSEEIQGYFNTLKNYSNSYIKKIHEQFTQAYKFAINKGYLYKNPMSDVIKPKSNKKDKIVRALTVEEQQDFTNLLTKINIQTEPYRNIFLIQMYMGLRIGETLALSNYDIDLKHNLLKVDKTLTTDKNGKVIMGDSAKTYAGNRELPIPEYIKPYILEQMRVAENNENKQLFLSPNGKFVDSRNVNRKLKKILKDNFNITDISTHSLRHTYGTRCVEAGMSSVALQRLMGHNDVSVTLNTYTSVFNRYKQSELDKVNNYYLNNSLMLENKELIE